jgi:hypothetical protein
MRSLVETPLLFRMGIIRPSSVPFSPSSLGSENLYLGRTLISASDAPSYIFNMKGTKDSDNIWKQHRYNYFS